MKPKKTKTISLKLSEPLYDLLDSITSNKSKLIRIILIKYLKQKGVIKSNTSK